MGRGHIEDLVIGTHIAQDKPYKNPWLNRMLAEYAQIPQF